METLTNITRGLVTSISSSLPVSQEYSSLIGHFERNWLQCGDAVGGPRLHVYKETLNQPGNETP